MLFSYFERKCGRRCFLICGRAFFSGSLCQSGAHDFIRAFVDLCDLRIAEHTFYHTLPGPPFSQWTALSDGLYDVLLFFVTVVFNWIALF